MAAVIIFLVGLVPGLPNLPFLVLSVLTGGLAYMAHRAREKDLLEQAKAQEVQPRSREVDPMENLPSLDLLELEVG